MELINIGFGNLISAQRLISIVSPDSAPVKRLIQESRDSGMLIDATYGRKTAAVLIMDSDHVVLSALSTEKLAPRLGMKVEDFTQEELLWARVRHSLFPVRPAWGRAQCSTPCSRSIRVCIFPFPPPREAPAKGKWTAYIIISSLRNISTR